MDYEAKFEHLDASMANDPALREKFINDPKSVLAGAGIPTMEALSGSALVHADASTANAAVESFVGKALPRANALNASNGYSLDLSKHWWGFDLTMNEELTQGIINGLVAGPNLTDLAKEALDAAGFIGGPLVAVIAAGFTAGFAMKKLEIELADKSKKGVHWPVTWPQLAALLAAAPLGPAAILAALAVWIHPLPN